MRQEIESTENEGNGAQYLKEDPLRTATPERPDEVRDPTEDQQPAKQQRDSDGRRGRLDDRKQPQQDEQHRRQDVPARESLCPLDHRTFGCHVTPRAYRSCDRLVLALTPCNSRRSLCL